MARRNPPTREMPQVASVVAAAIEARIGRAAYVRQVKNGDEWFIADPVFSFVQHGLRTGATGYRVGFFYAASRDELAFYMVHSPAMAKVFKKNLELTTLVEVAKSTAPFRARSYMFWSSRAAKQQGLMLAAVEDENINAFLQQVHEFHQEFDFKRDLFPPTENQGKGDGPSKWAGNDFGLLLAEKVSSFAYSQLESLVAAAWPLFLTLYPQEALEQRVASLARNLRSAGVVGRCEYHRITGSPPVSSASSQCSGPIEGAHVKPHSLGGTDLASNGMWLCRSHHRITEGRLAGQRGKVTFAVRFSEDT